MEEKLCKGTKSVKGNKKCVREQKMCKGSKIVVGKNCVQGIIYVPLSQNEVNKDPMNNDRKGWQNLF